MPKGTYQKCYSHAAGILNDYVMVCVYTFTCIYMHIYIYTYIHVHIMDYVKIKQFFDACEFYGTFTGTLKFFWMRHLKNMNSYLSTSKI